MTMGRSHQTSDVEPSIADRSIHTRDSREYQYEGPQHAVLTQLTALANRSPRTAVQRRLMNDIQQAPCMAIQRQLMGSTSRAAGLQSNPAPVQRVIVRVGFNSAQAGSWNPFVSGAHSAISTKVSKIPGSHKIFDYNASQKTLIEAEAGDIGDELHVIGHGQPGKIGGEDAATLAENIQTSLGTDAAHITKIRLHSCFSNVSPQGGESSGTGFGAKFSGVEVEAATGIHYADTATNLPPRFTGFKYGAKAAKAAFFTAYSKSGFDLLDEKHDSGSVGRQKISAAAKLLSNCIGPMEKFLKRKVAVFYEGLDPSGKKRKNNNDSYNLMLTTAEVNIDAMPPNIPYAEDLGSMKDGLNETYQFTLGVFNNLIKNYSHQGMATEAQTWEDNKKELETANQDSANGFVKLTNSMPP